MGPMALVDHLFAFLQVVQLWLPNDQRVEEGLTFIHMDGPEVYKFAVKTMGRTVLKSLERAGMELKRVGFLHSTSSEYSYY